MENVTEKITEELKEEIQLGLNKPANNLIYGASILSVVLSFLFLRRNPILATFTGLWAPTILGLGIFMKENKLMELERLHHEKHVAHV